MLLNNQWVNKEIKEKIKQETKKYVEISKAGNRTSPKQYTKREVYSDTGLPP